MISQKYTKKSISTMFSDFGQMFLTLFNKSSELMIQQKEIVLPPFRKGFHLITRYVEKELDPLPKTGLINIHIKHTSAALSLVENADPSVRIDLESFFNKLISENHPVYTHVAEGSDDMPAHIKSSLFGVSLTIPITMARLNLGTWQGICLCEFRNNGGPRTLVITVFS
jgi:secondary thiamine-phosphate synthase enzyme